MGARKLWEEDFESFAEELKGQSLNITNTDFLFAIEEITKVALMQKFKKPVISIRSPDEDIKFRFSIVNEKKKTYSCRPY